MDGGARAYAARFDHQAAELFRQDAWMPVSIIGDQCIDLPGWGINARRDSHLEPGFLHGIHRHRRAARPCRAWRLIWYPMIAVLNHYLAKDPIRAATVLPGVDALDVCLVAGPGPIALQIEARTHRMAEGFRTGPSCRARRRIRRCGGARGEPRRAGS